MTKIRWHEGTASHMQIKENKGVTWLTYPAFDPFLFVPVYCCCRIPITTGTSVFYFDKHQVSPVSGYQIDFSALAAKVLLNHQQSLFFQKGSRLFLIATARFSFIDTKHSFLLLCRYLSYYIL